MTDADLMPAGSRDELTARWYAALGRTEHTAARSRGASLASPIRIVRADSGRLLSDRRPGFCAVGDAAAALDPLAGNGVARALRSGLEAAEAIDQALSGAPLAESGIAERFADDLDRKARYYLLEWRWPAAPFWVRRHPPDWTTAPLTLTPTSVLRWDGRLPTRDVFAVAEALLPRGAITATLHELRTPQPAHVVLGALRNHAPLGDRRLLVGLQLLVEHGPLECVRVVTRPPFPA
jgi:2-polyprenyl-6-methoxyphenol hydroxylase-like FAD-dependent oxidoreductase